MRLVLGIISMITGIGIIAYLFGDVKEIFGLQKRRRSVRKSSGFRVNVDLKNILFYALFLLILSVCVVVIWYLLKTF